MAKQEVSAVAERRHVALLGNLESSFSRFRSSFPFIPAQQGSTVKEESRRLINLLSIGLKVFAARGRCLPRGG